MPDINLNNIKPAAAEKIKPFLTEILSKYESRIHSVHVTGSALTEDFDDKFSDVNSIIVLNKMDLKFLELLAPLGKKYIKHKVAAPLIMTPEYIKTSLDVFPVEFLNFRLIHSTAFGEDILDNVEINKSDLRHQCERELKTKLIWLRQGYLSSMGDRKLLSEGFVKSIAGYIPLFRAIIVLFDKEPPIRQGSVINELSEATGIDTNIFSKVLKEKHNKAKLTIDELNTIFEDYYEATEKIGKAIDDFQV